MRELTGFILNGGRSRRMGVDKASLPWRGRRLMDHMIETLGAVADPVRVVGGPELPDRRPGRGPVEGIGTALEATTTDENLIVAVDLPYLEAAFLEYLATRLREPDSGMVACELDGRTPLCLALHRNLLPQVDRYLDAGERSIQGLVRSIAHDTISPDQVLRAGFPPDMFRNLNTPEDYRRSLD